MIYLLSIPFIVFYVLYQKFQLKDLASKRNLIWKHYGVIIRIWFFISAYIFEYPKGQWQDYLIAGVLNEIIFELLINKIALKQSFWFVGSSSAWDNILGKRKWLLMGLALIITIFIKILI